MREETVVIVIHDSYLKNAKFFCEKRLIKDSAKILQLHYKENFSSSNDYIYKAYLKEVKRLYRLKRPSNEEKLLLLLNFVRGLREKYPTEFPGIGWWDAKQGLGMATK